MNGHWHDREIAALKRVASYDEAADIALTVLKRMHALGEPVVEICGPISTGGLGSLEKNAERFRAAIRSAHERGLVVFDQMHFQDVIERLSELHRNGSYDQDVLEVFYRRIFESGYIGKALFLPGWESSRGASWERALLTELGVPIEDYPLAWLAEELELVGA